MNTSYVAKLLGVSSSTIQRWVKQLNLEMERNEMGHYSFTEEDLAVFKVIHKQLQNGTILQDVQLARIHPRHANVKIVKNEPMENESGSQKLLDRVAMLERLVQSKADSVVSYQLLTHRREIEELEKEVNRLQVRLDALENKQADSPRNPSLQQPLVLDQEKKAPKSRKRNILTLLFGF